MNPYFLWFSEVDMFPFCIIRNTVYIQQMLQMGVFLAEQIMLAEQLVKVARNIMVPRIQTTIAK